MAERCLMAVGWDHHRTPVALRERLAIAREELAPLMQRLKERSGVEEIAVLCTCNRTEIYAAASSDRGCALVSALAQERELQETELHRSAYVHANLAAVHHLLRVAGSLESMVLGEYQIVHQIKQAYEAAVHGGHVGQWLHGLFQHALASAKIVRAETAIGKHKISVASVAVDLARHIHGDLSKAKVALVGAGEMAELAIVHLAAQGGVQGLTVVNRSAARAEELAGLHGRDLHLDTRSWDDLAQVLSDVDILVSSTAAPHAVIGVDMVRSAVRRRRRPLMLIDLAVPRDIEAGVADLDEVFLYNIDHLDRIVSENRLVRDADREAAEALLAHSASAWWQSHQADLGALRSRLAHWFDPLLDAESQRLCGRLGGQVDGQEVRYGLSRVTNKVAHRLHQWLNTHQNDRVALNLLAELLREDLH